MKKLLSACLLSTALLVGCPGAETADTEACEHLQNGPDTDVTASASANGAPAVNNDHRRYDIVLADVTDGKGGSVSFAASEAADYVFFLSKDVPFAVTNASGQPVPAESTAKSSEECTDIKARYVLPLAVGTYTLSFGPTTATNDVSLVIEEDVHEEEHAH